MLIERPYYLQKLISQKDKDIIKVITGVRRCGKSFLLFNIYYNYLLGAGVDEKHIIRINLENLENIGLRDALALYGYIKSRQDDSGKYYVMIDEIQYVQGFEDLVNSLKNSGCDVYITGSNSRLLSKDISTALSGRSIEIRVFTLSFAEFYAYRGGDKREALNEYLLYGGFPYAVTEDKPADKTQYLKMLEQTVASKDIAERYNVRNPALFNAVYDFLCSNIGSYVNAKKISDTLKSGGYKTAAPDTVINYLDYLCDAFLFSKVYRYDVKGREYLKTLNKYYITDLGLRNARINYRQTEITHLLENAVYLELVQRGYSVDIGKNNAKEIDFVVSNASDTYYIQVAYSAADPQKINQELLAFRGLDDGYRKILITMDSDPFTLLDRGYRKLDLISFLLDRDSLKNC